MTTRTSLFGWLFWLFPVSPGSFGNNAIGFAAVLVRVVGGGEEKGTMVVVLLLLAARASGFFFLFATDFSVMFE
jgi:hypothetical protein